MKYCIVLYLTQLLRDNITEKQFDKLYEFYCIYRRVVIKYIQYTLDITFLRRGVIGVSKVGYVL